MQISLGLPEPREFSSLPRLRLVQAGIQRMYLQHQTNPKICLPITPTILLQLHRYWSPRATDCDIIMIWGACTTCFFGFFRAGEIMLPNEKLFNVAHHLAWGDVTINDHKNPTILKVYLKKSKTDQLGKGVEVYMGSPLSSLSNNIIYGQQRKQQWPIL